MYLDIFARILLILGGLNYLFMSHTSTMSRIIAIAIGLSALYFLFDRDFYLPFLGKSVIPITTQQQDSKDLKQVILRDLPPNTNVIFWAAKGGKETASNPMNAYSEYANSGVAKTNDKGEAIISVACPVEYNVHYKKLMKHLHYRYELPGYRGRAGQSFYYTNLQNKKMKNF